MTFDVAVFGSGPAGAIASLMLALDGKQVVLVDKDGERAMKIGESLPGSATLLLKHLGLLHLVENSSHSPCYGNVFAWGGDGKTASTDFIVDPHGTGWHLERARFDRDLKQQALNQGVVFKPGYFSQGRFDGRQWELQTSRESLRANFVIDATGRAASVARKMGTTFIDDVPMMAASAWGRAENECEDRRTFVEAVPEGWWYCAGLRDQTQVLSFQTDADQFQSLCGTGPKWKEQFERTEHLRNYVKGARLVSDIVYRKAGGGRLGQFFGPGWLATGDAALAFDPISSLGIFNALYTGMKSASAACSTLEGDSKALIQYSERLWAIRESYLAKHQLLYHSQTRWPEAPFWRRRRV